MEPLKKSTIYVAIDGTTKVYDSLDEIPLLVRRKLSKSAGNWTSATILIADERGREEIGRAILGQPSPVQFRFLDSIELAADKQTSVLRRIRFPHRGWLAALLFPATAIFIWLVFVATR
jgi:hypothetical protein